MTDLFSIDLTILEKQWAEQPRLMRARTRKLAKANRDAAKAKAAFKLVAADLGQAIRKTPEHYGVEKVTDKVVEDTVIRQPEYQKVQAEMIEADYKAELLTGVVRALDHRKSALENEVKLHGQGYFATPQTKDDQITRSNTIRGLKKPGKGGK